MNIIVKIIKALLLWATVISVTFFIAGGIESLIMACNWKGVLIWTTINTVLVISCKNFLSYRDIYNLSGCRLASKLLE